MMDRSNWDFRKYTFFGELKDEEVIIINMHLVNFTARELYKKKFYQRVVIFFLLRKLKINQESY